MRNSLRIYKILYVVMCSNFTSNQCLKGSQPNVWMTIFLWVKLLVEWTVSRWPGVPQWRHLTPATATQQVSSQGQQPRHLGHTPPPGPPGPSGPSGPSGPATTSQPLALLLSLSPEPLLCLSILLWGSPAAAAAATEFSETEEQDFFLWLKNGFFSKSKNFS